MVSGYQNYNTEIPAAAVISRRVCFTPYCLARLALSRHHGITASGHQGITVRLHLTNIPSTAQPFFLSALQATSSASRQKAIGIIGADYEPGYGLFPCAISKIFNRFCWDFSNVAKRRVNSSTCTSPCNDNRLSFLSNVFINGRNLTLEDPLYNSSRSVFNRARVPCCVVFRVLTCQ